jgi:hypothetical protein
LDSLSNQTSANVWAAFLNRLQLSFGSRAVRFCPEQSEHYTVLTYLV